MRQHEREYSNATASRSPCPPTRPRLASTEARRHRS